MRLLILTMASSRAVVAKAQQLPQLPWSLTEVIQLPPLLRQSSNAGKAPGSGKLSAGIQAGTSLKRPPKRCCFCSRSSSDSGVTSACQDSFSAAMAS